MQQLIKLNLVMICNSINIIDASSLLGNARLIKDDHEISLMRKACDISAEAHIEAMKSVKSIDSEQHIESLYCNEFSKRGGRFQAYTPIVACGENACTLHYVENNQNLKKSDLLLVDARCIAKPIGIIEVFPGFNIIFSSRQALRSSPADPDVSYFGKGIESPIRGLIIFIFIFFKILFP